MRYDYKYRINNKDKGDLAMELKELTSAEQVVMKFWYKESGFDLVKTLYKGKLNEGKLKKLKKLLEEIDD